MYFVDSGDSLTVSQQGGRGGMSQPPLGGENSGHNEENYRVVRVEAGEPGGRRWHLHVSWLSTLFYLIPSESFPANLWTY